MLGNQIHIDTTVSVADELFGKKVAFDGFDDLVSSDTEGLLLESPDVEDVELAYIGEELLATEIGAMFEAITTKRIRLSQTMRAFIRVLNRGLNGTDISAGTDEAGVDVDGKNTVSGAIIGKVRRVAGVPVMTALIPLSDGQSTSIIFHSPTADGPRIKNNDLLVAFQFLLNKRDVTHVVAPIGGRDVTLNQVCQVLSNLIERNSGKFKKAQEKQDKLRTDILAIEDEADKLENERSVLIGQVDQAQSRLGKAKEKFSEADEKLRAQKAINVDLTAYLERLKSAAKNTVTRKFTEQVRTVKKRLIDNGETTVGDATIKVEGDAITLTSAEGGNYKIPVAGDGVDKAATKLLKAYRDGDAEEFIVRAEPEPNEDPVTQYLSTVLGLDSDYFSEAEAHGHVTADDLVMLAKGLQADPSERNIKTALNIVNGQAGVRLFNSDDEKDAAILSASASVNWRPEVIEAWMDKFAISPGRLSDHVSLNAYMVDQDGLDMKDSWLSEAIRLRVDPEQYNMGMLKAYSDYSKLSDADRLNLTVEQVQKIYSDKLREGLNPNSTESELRLDADMFLVSVYGTDDERKLIDTSRWSRIDDSTRDSILTKAERLREEHRIALQSDYTIIKQEPQSEPSLTEPTEPQPISTEAGGYQYALQNRPAGIGAVPEGQVGLLPRPDNGSAYYEYARHGIITYNRQLTDEEVRQCELKYLPNDDEYSDIAREFVAKAFDKYAAEYLNMSEEDSDTFEKTVRSKFRKDMENVAFPKGAAEDVMMKKIVNALAEKTVSEPEPEPEPAPGPSEADNEANQAIQLLKSILALESSDMGQLREARSQVRSAVSSLQNAGRFEENESLVNDAARHLSDLLVAIQRNGGVA